MKYLFFSILIFTVNSFALSKEFPTIKGFFICPVSEYIVEDFLTINPNTQQEKVFGVLELDWSPSGMKSQAPGASLPLTEEQIVTSSSQSVTMLQTTVDYAIASKGYALVDGQKTRFVPFSKETIATYSLEKNPDNDEILKIKIQATTFSSTVNEKYQEIFTFTTAKESPIQTIECRHPTPEEVDNLVK